jgi:hypothetical protein
MSCPNAISMPDFLRAFRAAHEIAAQTAPVVWHVPLPRKARPMDRLKQLDEYMTARFRYAGPLDPRPVWGNARRLCCGAMLALAG